mmetsp:Transcript_35559/g.65516  ORF Transcript_35559/g.65516 Transcript_35559/m.65516 type:complete len:433 (-) Transcript_35559:68-1366(-)
MPQAFFCEQGYDPIKDSCNQDRRPEINCDEDIQAYTPLNLAHLAEASEELSEGLKNAVAAGDALQVRSMLRKRADVNHRYNMGLTPLHFAALHNKCQVVRMLIYNGAEIFAETEDGCTAGVIAEMEGHSEVVQILCDNPPVKNPWRRRYMGPSILTAFILANTVICTLLVKRSWLPADVSAALAAREEGAVPIALMNLGYTLAAVAIISLALANSLDPGTVQRNTVEFVKELPELVRELTGDDEDERGTFTVLRPDGQDKDGYRWCRSCELWKPPKVSHCAECKRCFWRFDHHCAAAGNCIAARNHRFFASLLVCGALAWTIGMVCVLLKLNAVNAEAKSGERPWEHQAAIAYLIFGFVCLTPLALFGIFHTGALLFNFNTKMVLRPHSKQMEYSRFNNGQELGLLFSMPWEWRAPGPPTPLEPRIDDRNQD